MSALVLAALLSATWTDATGHVRCSVPDGFTALPNQPWAFARADGLRQLVYLPVKPVAATPGERSRQLLERVGAAGIASDDVSASGLLRGSIDVAAAFAIAKGEPTWAGVMVLGPAATDVGSEAEKLAAGCRSVQPVVDGGRIWDATHRLSCAVPQGAQAVEVRGAGAAQTQAWVVRLIAVQPRGKASLQELAAQWLNMAGTPALASAAVNGREVATATQTMVQSGVDYVVEVMAIDLGNGEVGGVGLSTNAAAQSSARAAVRSMVEGLAVTAPAAPLAPGP